MVHRKRNLKRTNASKFRSLSREFETALRESDATAMLKRIRPREFVDLMTRSSFEIEREFKRHLRDNSTTGVESRREKIPVIEECCEMKAAGTGEALRWQAWVYVTRIWTPQTSLLCFLLKREVERGGRRLTTRPNA